ncbi:carbohydrate kinase [Pseudarthrobacter sp. NamB4]|nr:carbohydrate kinase [Pseudarthrobacter sp. NamB4]TLM70538.1 carbohydrate kinase [Pseudarthrobacter sp. NamB4]
MQSHHQIPDVIVVGEALADVVISREGTFEHPGGSPANVAYGLGRLGISTTLLTSLGDDERADGIEAHLRSADVELLPGSRGTGRTASAIATLAADGSARYDFDISWELPPVTPGFLPKILHTGSIATFLSPGAASVKALVERAHRECLVTYDPNIRPAILRSQAVAKNIFEDFVTFVDVVKLSDQDAWWLYPGRQLEDIAAHILDLGAEMAVITRGSEGSLLSTADAQVTIPSVKSVVADTIGAGDAYMAALIYGLLTRPTDGLAPALVERIGRTASKAAAITVRRPGVNPPTLAELHADIEEQ